MRGKFITFEGGEGTGKSTQAKLLVDRLATLGINSVLTREPGGSTVAEIIRHVILSGAAKPLGAEAEAMLFAAARDDHLTQTIRPALERGDWVVCDRFSDSTRVYQGVLGQVDPRMITRLEKITVGDTKPDLTLVLDVAATIGLSRAKARRGTAQSDRFESEDIAFHERLNEAYRQLAISEPDRCALIDAGQTQDKVANDIWAVVSRKLDPTMPPLEIEDLGR